MIRRALPTVCCVECVIFAEVKHAIGAISADIAAQALDMLNVDAEGFDYMDRKLLLAVIDKFFGGR